MLAKVKKRKTLIFMLGVDVSRVVEFNIVFSDDVFEFSTGGIMSPVIAFAISLYLA